MLNIIIAVVVDTFAEARQNDIMNLAEETGVSGLGPTGLDLGRDASPQPKSCLVVPLLFTWGST